MEESTPKSSKGLTTPLIIGIVVVLLVAGVAGAVLLKNPQGNKTSNTSTPTGTNDQAPNDDALMIQEQQATGDAMMQQDATGGAAIESTGARTVTVTGTNFKFDVPEIRVKQGDRVTINFKNAQGFHDWVLDEFNAKTKQLQANQSETITFVANKKGTFQYYCSIGNHRQMGMVGNLIVE